MQSMGIVGSYELLSNNSPLNSSNAETPQNSKVEIAIDMELKDLLRIYDQEQIRLLSSFVGRCIKVYVSLADKKFRRLTFSLKPKEKVEMVEKKKNLMVLIWDVDSQPNLQAVLGALESRPDLILTSYENAEFALAMFPTEPFVLSRADKFRCLIEEISLQLELAYQSICLKVMRLQCYVYKYLEHLIPSF